jgi:hypothetical protein
MDAIKLSLLRAEIERQMDRITQVYDTLEQRIAELSSGGAPLVESAAYQTHNYYSAVEDLLQIVAKAFENNVVDLARWHSELIDRMTLHIPGVRPPLLSTQTATLLHRLRGFRHFFRHAYDVPLDPSEVQQNWNVTQQLRPLVEQDVATFLQALEPTN